LQSVYPTSFDREMGCTEADWLARLPGAVRSHRLTVAKQTAHVDIDDGRLLLAWSVLSSRRIALMCVPRLAVRFRFLDVCDESRHRFMRYFDLYMQRGGG
jgi:hypothetical protein